MEKTTGAVNLLNLTAQAGLANLPNIGKQAMSTSDISFSQALTQTSGTKPVDNAKSEVAQTKTVVETSKGLSRNIKTADDGIGQNEKSLSGDEMEEVAKEVEKAVTEVIDKIKEQFGVSEEDIEEAMEVLGLSMQNVFDASNLRSLVMELTGTNDSIELLTNVELYDGVKNVSALADELFAKISEDFGMTVEQLTEVVNTESFEQVFDEIVSNVAENENIEVTNAENFSEPAVKVEVIDERKVDDDALAKLTEDREETKDDVSVVNVESGMKEEKEDFEIKPEEKVQVEKSEEVRTQNPVITNEMSNGNSQTTSDNNKKNGFNENTKTPEINVQATGTTTQTVNTVSDVVETVTSYTSYADTENIMRQVTDYVRVNITEDVTKMEMQLHPASLGTVNMQINSQNGQITAHLTVQNELVKSVLESQMVKLQETFNEQGTKVTAIEVTVANYNLDSNGDNGYSQERENNKKGNGRKGINLNELDSFDELTDEEQLQAEVMEMNGSSVNYTA